MPKIAARTFTERWVGGVKANGTPQDFSDAGAKGLGLRISRDGHKAWRLSYSYGNERRRPSIGQYPRMSLADARAKRDEVFRALHKGIDLLAGTAPSERADFAFNKIAEEFIRFHVEAKSKDPGDARNIIRNELVAAWGSRDIRTISRRDVHALLDGVAKRAPIQANRVLRRGSKLFKWALQRGYRDDSPFFAVEMPSKERSRTRVLKDAELKAIWRGVETIGHPYEPIVKLLMILGQRRDEVSGMRWAGLDLEAAIWTTETKTSAEHVLPLPEIAVEIITKLPRIGGSDHVFPSKTNAETCVSGFSKWKDELDTACKVTCWRHHDLRRTQATAMARLGVLPHIIDRIQNHVISGEAVRNVSKVYNRHLYLDEMRAALEKWAAHIERLAAS